VCVQSITILRYTKIKATKMWQIGTTVDYNNEGMTPADELFMQIPLPAPLPHACQTAMIACLWSGLSR